jgi:hypothetical protein
LDLDSISIQTCFLNLFLEFIRTTYPGNLYPIGLPDLTRLAYPNLARTAYSKSTQAPYSSLAQSHQCIPGLIHSYSAELSYPFLLPIRLLLTQPYTVLPGRITLPDLLPIELLSTRSYPATLLDFLTRSGTLQLASPKNFHISLPP